MFVKLEIKNEKYVFVSFVAVKLRHREKLSHERFDVPPEKTCSWSNDVTKGIFGEILSWFQIFCQAAEQALSRQYENFIWIKNSSIKLKLTVKYSQTNLRKLKKFAFCFAFKASLSLRILWLPVLHCKVEATPNYLSIL